ncbi:MAG: hypothetical protein EXR78_01550 [Deltaproteobacteria bacterium]|nr:hypothetical protein [Deltaproteobacteria bacterium]
MGTRSRSRYPRGGNSETVTKFYRIDNRLTRDIGGTGLGLALVKEIITAHNGRVWVESTAGKGSTFFLTVPVAGNEPRT